MSAPDLFHIEALATAATPGPWEVDTSDPPDNRRPAWVVGPDGDVIADVQGLNVYADARYIAALSPDVALALVAEVKRLRRVEEAAKALVDPADADDSTSAADAAWSDLRAALRGEP